MLATIARKRRRVLRRDAICLFKPDRLGDFIIALGALHYARKRLGAENLVLVVSEVAAEAAHLLLPDVRVASMPIMGNRVLARGVPVFFAEHSRFLNSLGAGKLACLRHQRGVGEELILSRIPALRSYGIENPGWCLFAGEEDAFRHRFAAAREYPRVSAQGLPLEMEAHRQVLEMLLEEPVSHDEIIPKLGWPNETPTDKILISPFASTQDRSFPAPLLIETLRAIGQPSNCVLSAAPEDRTRLLTLTQQLAAAGIRGIEIEMPATVAEYFRSVAAARLILSVDTATAHLATALDKPAVILLGGGHYGVFGPWRRSERQRWLTQELPCFHCNWNCKFSETRCISEIAPERIAQEMDRAIDFAPVAH